ncbi:MAG TPA: L-aspartate oxidase [Acidobacteriota bacterium]|nr:L-aspartate oxidase [Acidobacteriota bacterium]
MQKFDFVIIGSGVAGLRAAIDLSKRGSVAIITKSKPDESNTEYAQGGVAVAMSDEDDIWLHFDDTIQAGDGLCEPEAVHVLVEEGPERIQELIDWGTNFDRDGSQLSFTQEAAHSRHRVLHARGDSTGKEIIRSLLQTLKSAGNLTLMDHTFALDLIIRQNECRGVRFVSERTRSIDEVESRAVLICTGGAGQIFRDTTNPDIATGDGPAMGFRAGAELVDLEFFQFHPTALALAGAPRFLLTEALRGEGGVLRNQAGERFMERYHVRKELAPRDVVSRGIFAEMRKTGQPVYLDMTHLDSEFLKTRFPTIYHTCLRYGLNLARDPIPVQPAAHYMMGGLRTDLNGACTLKNLFAAGEAACTGVHGANRLASNSLLEGLVFGARAADAMGQRKIFEGPVTFQEARLELPPSSIPSRDDIRDMMTARVGIERNATDLQFTVSRLAARFDAADRLSAETNNMSTLAYLIASAALARQESRGAHFRTDFPARDDVRWRKRIILKSKDCKYIEVATLPVKERL